MNLNDVERQLTDVYDRAIESGASVQQNFPARGQRNGLITIGDLKETAIALRNIPYTDIYQDLEKNNQYHIKLPDGGLIIFQYSFNKTTLITIKHRLAYFPSPALPTTEEAPELYNHDNIYADIILKRIVRFPIRFDYDPQNYKPKYHPHSHVTFGQFENCRIPVTHPVSPNTFFLFILRNFYHLVYRRNQNKFDKKISHCKGEKCITEAELPLPYFSIDALEA